MAFGCPYCECESFTPNPFRKSVCQCQHLKKDHDGMDSSEPAEKPRPKAPWSRTKTPKIVSRPKPRPEPQPKPQPKAQPKPQPTAPVSPKPTKPTVSHTVQNAPKTKTPSPPPPQPQKSTPTIVSSKSSRWSPKPKRTTTTSATTATTATTTATARVRIIIEQEIEIDLRTNQKLAELSGFMNVGQNEVVCFIDRNGNEINVNSEANFQQAMDLGVPLRIRRGVPTRMTSSSSISQTSKPPISRPAAPSRPIPAANFSKPSSITNDTPPAKPKKTKPALVTEEPPKPVVETKQVQNRESRSSSAVTRPTETKKSVSGRLRGMTIDPAKLRPPGRKPPTVKPWKKAKDTPSPAKQVETDLMTKPVVPESYRSPRTREAKEFETEQQDQEDSQLDFQVVSSSPLTTDAPVVKPDDDEDLFAESPKEQSPEEDLFADPLKAESVPKVEPKIEPKEETPPPPQEEETDDIFGDKPTRRSSLWSDDSDDDIFTKKPVQAPKSSGGLLSMSEQEVKALGFAQLKTLIRNTDGLSMPPVVNKGNCIKVILKFQKENS